VATIGAFVLALGIVLALANVVLSLRGGVAAGPDPWGGTSLEWFALSPPPPHNFDVLPDVRSHEPLRDIRDAIARQGAAAGTESAESQPVA
jgi:heme/copper-type cytochrome/quinol oxidase subunit 1